MDLGKGTFTLPTPKVKSHPQSNGVFVSSPAFTSQQFVAWLNYRRETETLAAIAASLGVSVTAICRWRDGVRRPSRPILMLAYCRGHQAGKFLPLKLGPDGRLP